MKYIYKGSNDIQHLSGHCGCIELVVQPAFTLNSFVLCKDFFMSKMIVTIRFLKG